MKKPSTIQILFLIVVFNMFWTFIKPNLSWDPQEDVIEVDSTKVSVDIPSKSGAFETRQNLRPIIVNNYLKDGTQADQYKALIADLESKHGVALDSMGILKELLEAKKIREYTEKYEDSNLVGTVNTKTEGYLKEQTFDYKIKPSVYDYWEKTYTEKLTPRFSLYAGGGFNGDYSDLGGSSFEVNAGIQNKKGDIFELGYNTNKQIRLGYKKRLFVKYKNKD